MQLRSAPSAAVIGMRCAARCCIQTSRSWLGRISFRPELNPATSPITASAFRRPRGVLDCADARWPALTSRRAPIGARMSEEQGYLALALEQRWRLHRPALHDAQAIFGFGSLLLLAGRCSPHPWCSRHGLLTISAAQQAGSSRLAAGDRIVPWAAGLVMPDRKGLARDENVLIQKSVDRISKPPQPSMPQPRRSPHARISKDSRNGETTE